jgi:hypothetical protein
LPSRSHAGKIEDSKGKHNNIDKNLKFGRFITFPPVSVVDLLYSKIVRL